MRVRLKGINSKQKRLADGSLKTYHYAWKSGPRLRGEPGSAEFIASYNAAVAQKVPPPTGVLLALLFRFSGERRIQIRNIATHSTRLPQTDKAHRTRLW
jgi:hypothetical protein